MCTLLFKPRNPVPCRLHQNHQWDWNTGLQVFLLFELLTMNIALCELQDINLYHKLAPLCSFLKENLNVIYSQHLLTSPAPEFKCHLEHFVSKVKQ